MENKKIETKVFELPEHPTRGKQQIVVERPSKESVWYLVIEKDRAIPLPNLKNPENPKQVLDVLGEQIGENGVFQYIAEGYSKLN